MKPNFFTALELAKGLAATPKSINSVANATSDEAARWAFTQWELRKRAAAKFSRADQMLFTREALEQATAEPVANLRASRWPKGEQIADLTCGIGSDLIALASRGPAAGYDLDAERLEYAQSNLTAYGEKASLTLQNCLEIDPTPEFFFCDPSRRTNTGRTLDPDSFAPHPGQIAERGQSAKLAAMKLTPMLRDEMLEEWGVGLEFWSHAWECKEALVWMGGDAERWYGAVQVESGLRIASGGDGEFTDTVGQYLFEADPAARRAHAWDALCEMAQASRLYDGSVLTGNAQTSSPWLRRFEVIEELPYSEKEIKARLVHHRARTPIIKSTIPIPMEKLTQSLKREGEQELVLWVIAHGAKRKCILSTPEQKPHKSL